MSPDAVASAGRGDGPYRGVSLLAMSVVLLLGCADPDAVERHSDGEGGPLSATSGGGGFAMQAPGTLPWHGSFGTFFLCTRTPGEQITLRDVRYEAEVEPLEVTPYLRIVHADDVVRDDDGSTTRGGMLVGKPPNLDDGKPVPGTFTTEIAGHVISDSCDELSDLDAGYTELIFVMKNDERGGYLPGASIDYTTDDGRYVLDIEWAMISCGSAIPEVDGDDLCAPL